MRKWIFLLSVTLFSLGCNAEVLLGKLSENQYLDRIAYEVEYDKEKRIPKWVYYVVKPDFLNTPPRKGKYKKFRADPDIDNPVVHKDYTNSGFARGHLAPFFTSGGDRDGDGLYSGGPHSDADEEQTVFEVNYMSNITPQDQKCFNGAGGVWYKLETHVRKELVQQQGRTVHVFAGPVFFEHQKVEYIGPNNDIGVPHAFFKVLAFTNNNSELVELYPFLFPHNKKHSTTKDCEYEKKPFTDKSFAVSIDKLESLTGLDFFSELSDKEESRIERAINPYKQ